MYDEEYPAKQSIIDLAHKEVDFINQHKNRTGRYWRSFYGEAGPRPPPMLYMWPADEVGQVHRVVSNHSMWQCDGMMKDCQSSDPVELELEVISLEPRAFIIKNFMSAYEADAIVNVAEPLLAASMIGQEESGGAMVSTTRSSENSWVVRWMSVEIDTITRRAADLLQIDQSLLVPENNAEEMQVVHYSVGQKYDPHNDWSVDGQLATRFITLLFYLTDKASEDAGGETGFPKAAGGRGIKVHPGKGSAVLFYNLLPDGNGDDMSLHESRPVKKGEKWLANYWVWDPYRVD